MQKWMKVNNCRPKINFLSWSIYTMKQQDVALPKKKYHMHNIKYR